MLRGGRRATALEIQWGLLERARKYERSHGLACVGEEVGADVLAGGSACSPGSRHDPDSVADGSTGWPSSASSTATPSVTVSAGRRRLKALDLQYHDMRARAVPRPPCRARDPRRPGGRRRRR